MVHGPDDDPYKPGQADLPVERSDTAGKILLVVIAVMLSINCYLLIGVVPKFKTMFEALGGELPQVTVLVLFLSNFMTQWFLPLLVVLALGAWFIWRQAIRISLAVQVPVLLLLLVTMVSIPLAIFYPIMQLQSAVRGDVQHDQPPDQPPPKQSGPEVQ